MSSRNVSSQQLAMFMTPHEIAKTSKFSDAGFYGGDRQMLDIKKRESELTGLDQSIKDKGVQKPINIYHTSKEEGGHTEVVDGHHRLASALQHRPHDLVPVLHMQESDLGKPNKYKNSDSDWAHRQNKELINTGEDW